MMRVPVFASRRAIRFVVPAALAIVLLVCAVVVSPRAMAAVQDAATACNQTVRTVVTKLRKNTPTRATLARWAAWKVKHPDWHPSANAKPRPRFLKTSTVGYRNVKLACEVGSAGKLTGTLVPVEDAFIPFDDLNSIPTDDLMPAPVVFASTNPFPSTGYIGPSYPPILPSGGGGGGSSTGGGITALPPPVPEMPSIILALTGVLAATAGIYRRRRLPA